MEQFEDETSSTALEDFKDDAIEQEENEVEDQQNGEQLAFSMAKQHESGLRMGGSPNKKALFCGTDSLDHSMITS